MTRRPSIMAGIACLAGLCLMTAGCTRSEEAPPADGTNLAPRSTATSQPPAATSQDLAIDFRSEPDPPQEGDNTFEVTVKQTDGSPITDATITVVFSMAAMPSMNMPAMRSTAILAHQASGRYRGIGLLSMDGTWNVMVTVSRGAEELGSKKFSVVAR